MANLSSVLHGIPGLRGWQAQDQFRQEQMQGDQATQINQMKLAQIFEQAQEQKKMQEIARMSGGDPAKAQQLFLEAGMIDPAAKAYGMIPKAGNPERTPDFAQLIQIEKAYRDKGDTVTADRIATHLNNLNQPKQIGETPADKLAREKFEFEKSQGGKAPSGYRYTKDGGLEAIPGGPADTKELQKSSTQELGRENVSTVIAQLRDAYGQLQTGGGITDPNASSASNLTAGVASSGLGQATGRLFGTQNQSKRNEILMTRPALLAHIMRATGMSAKQMDSNTELKLWLSTATDPTLDISANMQALDNIEKTYGLAGGQSAEKPTQQPAQQTHNTMPNPKNYAGKIARDTVSGKRYQSNGTTWILVK